MISESLRLIVLAAEQVSINDPLAYLLHPRQTDDGIVLKRRPTTGLPVGGS
jgi:hypothetical protein